MTTSAFLLAALAAGLSLVPQAGPAHAQQTPIQGETAMTQSPETGTLKVPGATLYYERWGQGPMLLVIPGGPQDAGVFAGLASALSDRYTVVAYDPRGNSRSSFDGAVQPLDLDTQADDAAALIDALGQGSAYVFGTSGGAQIGLNLAARYPGKVKALLAHEPPTTMLLDDPAEAIAFDQKVYETYKTEGVDAAMAMFFGAADLSAAPPEFDMPPEAAETFARVAGNFEYWLAHGMLPLSLYRPDVETLKTSEVPVIVGIGAQSEGMPISEMSRALASALDVAPVTFPGDHTGFEQDPQTFAQTLHQSLSAN
ncbi:alpha/beta fold hydrolase [Pelagibacterium xiamenense]|uniref:alpha/beta fold hydrolase n=1 Tax=Pelagibacterium xiamenense TaxID=2901140 RepID=UPI001E2AC20A|nr:alpha/beta hydrolase [Pelagibacterium xiamenense]MCD7059289.1 alpha/beta hydrolase [Pelagibacterium xiamenense]